MIKNVTKKSHKILLLARFLKGAAIDRERHLLARARYMLAGIDVAEGLLGCQIECCASIDLDL